MNRQTFFNRFLIVLLSSLLALAIIVNAHNYKHKTCTSTEISKHTVTVTKSCKSQPTHKTQNNCHHDHHDRRNYHHDHHDRKNRHCKTVTCTPTTTQCSTPPPAPTCCEAPGAPGFEGSIHNGVESSKQVIDNTLPDGQACCKSCLADPTCTQWLFAGISCIRHINAGEVCSIPLVPFPVSGIIRCGGEGCNVPAP
jgi:hypothetical protein